MSPSFHLTWPPLRKVNNLLAACVVVLGMYMVVAPFAPSVWFHLHHPVSTPYAGQLAHDYHRPVVAPIPKDNRLVLPTIGLNEPIKEGRDISVLNSNGVWRRPNGSDNPQSGNMVIIGHRFLYTNPYGTFYNLDKLKAGDKLAVYWQHKEYVYSVKTTRVVDPNDASVEAPTPTPRLTLYTCTPLLTARDRLVVVAERDTI